MANPQVIEINPDWKWIKIATSINLGSIRMVNRRINYYATYRGTGDSAPADPTAPTDNAKFVPPDEAVKIFSTKTEEDISANELVDVYLFCTLNDLYPDDIGKVVINI